MYCKCLEYSLYSEGDAREIKFWCILLSQLATWRPFAVEGDVFVAKEQFEVGCDHRLAQSVGACCHTLATVVGEFGVDAAVEVEVDHWTECHKPRLGELILEQQWQGDAEDLHARVVHTAFAQF